MQPSLLRDETLTAEDENAILLPQSGSEHEHEDDEPAPQRRHLGLVSTTFLM